MTFLIYYLKALGIVVLMVGGITGIFTAIGYAGSLIVEKYGDDAGIAIVIFFILCIIAIPIAIGMCAK